MPRVVGVDIPNEKRVVIALTYIHGIGKHTAQSILKATGIDENVRAKDLSEDELSNLGAYIENNHLIEGELRRQEAQHLSRLRDINCYRGIRHKRGLPVRGQRTRTNARTRKGRKKTVAGRRSVKELGG